MLRSTAFNDVNPKHKIYPSKKGQNFQLLLPISYKYRCGYIDESLFNYVIRKGSLSHSGNSIEKRILMCDEHEEILFNVLRKIKGLNFNRYKKIIKEKYINRKIYYASIYKNLPLLKKLVSKLIRKKHKLNEEAIRGLKTILPLEDKEFKNLKEILLKLKNIKEK